MHVTETVVYLSLTNCIVLVKGCVQNLIAVSHSLISIDIREGYKENNSKMA